MIDERGLDIMEVEADVMVMKLWRKFEIEFLGSRAYKEAIGQDVAPAPEVGEDGTRILQQTR